MTHDASALTLPEELLLLTLDPLRGKPLCDRTYLRYGTAGAVLAELEFQGRIREEHGRVQVVNPLDPAQPLLASLLRTLDRPGKSRLRSGTAARRWVRQYGRDAEERHLDVLTERGLLRRETRRFLGLFPYQRHFPAADTGLAASARRRFTQAEARGFPDQRSRALAGLISATGLAGTLTADGRAGRKAMKALRRAQWTASAVHHNVKQSRSSGGSGGDGGDGGSSWSDGGGGGGCGGGGGD